MEASTTARTYYRREATATTDGWLGTPENDTSLLLAEEAGWDSFTDADLLAATAKGHGSSRAVVVDHTWQNKNRVFPVHGPDVAVAAVRRRVSS